jgi:hypothetical protein
MIMRFHWGLAVGHTYTHEDISHCSRTAEGCLDEESIPGAPGNSEPGPSEKQVIPDENREYSLDDCDHVDWGHDSDVDEANCSVSDEDEAGDSVVEWYVSP